MNSKSKDLPERALAEKFEQSVLVDVLELPLVRVRAVHAPRGYLIVVEIFFVQRRSDVAFVSLNVVPQEVP